jgi:hypothetical protein
MRLSILSSFVLSTLVLGFMACEESENDEEETDSNEDSQEGQESDETHTDSEEATVGEYSVGADFDFDANPPNGEENSGLSQTQEDFSTASETFDLRNIFLPPQADGVTSEAGISDLSQNLGDWTSVVNECLVKFGDWDCSTHNWVTECDGYWNEVRLQAHPFVLVWEENTEPSVSLDSQISHPEIPADVPMVQSFGMETWFVSPIVDLSGDGDVFEFEYRVSSIDQFAFQIMLDDESGRHLLHEFHPPENTGINHPSTSFETVSIDLEQFYSGCPSCPTLLTSQSGQATISIGVLYNSGLID